MRQKFMATPRCIWAAMVVGLAPIAGCELMEEGQEIEFRAAGLPRPATQEGPLLDEGESSGDSGALGETEGWPLEWEEVAKQACLPGKSPRMPIAWLNDDEPPPPPTTPPPPCPPPSPR